MLTKLYSKHSFIFIVAINISGPEKFFRTRYVDQIGNFTVVKLPIVNMVFKIFVNVIGKDARINCLGAEICTSK